MCGNLPGCESVSGYYEDFLTYYNRDKVQKMNKVKLTKKGRGGVVMDSEDYEREKAEKKLLIKLQEAEEVV